MRHVLLRSARLTDGELVDIGVVDGLIDSVHPAGTATSPNVPVQVMDLNGRLVLPAFTEPHAHLDKTGTVDRVPNPTGDLGGAITAWLAHRPTLTVDDVLTRARVALRRAALNGVLTLRTHVDTGAGVFLTAMEAIAQLRTEVQDLVELQIVACASLPITGAAGRENLTRLRDALRYGVDAVGGAPSLDPDPVAAVDALADIAADAGLPLDLHIDETLDPAVFVLPHLATVATAFDLPVTAGHCVSLAMQPAPTRRAVADQLAAAGVAVVTLPQTNLYLQGRDLGPHRPRGLTAVAELRAAGVVVAGGSDNIADPFNPIGRTDPLETASLLVAAGQLDVGSALDAVTTAARQAIGLPPAPLAPGMPADLVAIDAASPADAVGRAPAARLVLRRGQPVATTTVVEAWSGDDRRDHRTLHGRR